jgi:hypothetical protein
MTGGIDTGEALAVWAVVGALCLVCLAAALGVGEGIAVATVVVAAVGYGLYWLFA